MRSIYQENAKFILIGLTKYLFIHCLNINKHYYFAIKILKDVKLQYLKNIKKISDFIAAKNSQPKT